MLLYKRKCGNLFLIFFHNKSKVTRIGFPFSALREESTWYIDKKKSIKGKVRTRTTSHRGLRYIKESIDETSFINPEYNKIGKHLTLIQIYNGHILIQLLINEDFM